MLKLTPDWLPHSPKHIETHREEADLMQIVREVSRMILTDEEKSILYHYLDGFPGEEIAKKLGLSRSTICRRLSSIGEKLRCEVGAGNIRIIRLDSDASIEALRNEYNRGSSIYFSGYPVPTVLTISPFKGDIA